VQDQKDKPTILVTGATGYVGGRLVPLLLKKGYRVRAAVRSQAKAKARSWAKHPNLKIVTMDVLRPESLKKACQGCHSAYYLVHSMNPGQSDFSEADRLAARNMVEAAAESNLDRIIYLGGLGEEGADLSKHLASRHEVADILQSGSVPVTVLRAGAILGSGSASFEILRYLVDRLPVMITPRWVSTLSQPIAIGNVLQYLVGCMEHLRGRGGSQEALDPVRAGAYHEAELLLDPPGYTGACFDRPAPGRGFA
jgi:uncharacterized protein YbjT (DUF2867 family)